MPITVFRPFSEEIQAIVAIKEPNPVETNVSTPKKKSGAEDDIKTSYSERGSSLIITIGKGYRSLIGRYVNMDKRNSLKTNSETESYKMAVNRHGEELCPTTKCYIIQAILYN